MAVDLDYQSPTQLDSDPWTIPLEDIDMSQGYLFKAQKHHDFFKRLRRDDPVHYHAPNPNTGPFWSITKFDDIMEVEKNTAVFSSEPSIALIDEILNEQQAPMFIAMDPPLHDEQRAVVAPAASAERVADLDDLIRERTIEVLSGLPHGKPFNWVDEVSIELTTRMLATLFDFPFEERRKLTFWSDMITTPPFLGATRKRSAWNT